MYSSPHLIALAIFGLSVASLLFRAGMRRHAEDVWADILEQEAGPLSIEPDSTPEGKSAEEYIKAGFLTAKERRAFALNIKFTPVYFILGVLLFHAFNHTQSGPAIFLSCFFALCGGYIFSQRRLRLKQAAYRRALEAGLPMAIERVVMAVGAGYSIVPALQRTVDIEIKKAESARVASKQTPDPVTVLFHTISDLIEKGFTFEAAVNEVSRFCNCPAFQHALVHLSHTHKQGGEIIGPLKELAESTQLRYQDSIEEEIAKLPAKATGPLMVMFAGALMAIMNTPLMQLTSVLSTSLKSLGH